MKKDSRAAKDPQTTKLERTGETTFKAHLEDGSYAEGHIDPSKVRFSEDGMRLPGGSKYISVNGLGKSRHNIMSNATRRELGLPEDPNLDK